jgi:hypothetical protein
MMFILNILLCPLDGQEAPLFTDTWHLKSGISVQVSDQKTAALRSGPDKVGMVNREGSLEEQAHRQI